jgi:CRP/FNR family transcriptional regulator, cyclic AMP receptor protein
MLAAQQDSRSAAISLTSHLASSDHALLEDLRRVELFSNLPEGALIFIAAHARIRAYPKGVVVIQEGDEARALFVVLSGAVKAYVSDTRGREFVLNTLMAPAYFGELALLGALERTASVVTTCPTQLIVISRECIESICTNYPKSAFDLIAGLARCAQALTAKVRALAMMDVYQRLAQELHALSAPKEDERVLPDRITHQDLADRIGASREMVSRILKDLVAGGYLSIEKKHIAIKRRLPASW